MKRTKSTNIIIGLPDNSVNLLIEQEYLRKEKAKLRAISQMVLDLRAVEAVAADIAVDTALGIVADTDLGTAADTAPRIVVEFVAVSDPE